MSDEEEADSFFILDDDSQDTEDSIEVVNLPQSEIETLKNLNSQYVAELEQKNEQLLKLTEELNRERNESISTKGKLANLEQELKDREEEIKDFKINFEEMKANLEVERKSCLESDGQLSVYKQNVKDKDEEIASLKETLQKMTVDLEVERKSSLEANQQLSVYKQDMKDRDEEINSLKETLQKMKIDLEESQRSCLEANELLSASQQKVKDRDKEIIDLKTGIQQQLSIARQHATDLVQGHRHDNSKIQTKVRVQIEKLEDKIKKSEAECELYKKELKEMRGNMEVEQRQQTAELNKENDRVKKEVQNENEIIRILEEKLKQQAAEMNNENDRLKKEVEDKNETIRNLEEELEIIKETEIENNEKRIRELDAKLLFSTLECETLTKQLNYEEENCTNVKLELSEENDNLIEEIQKHCKYIAELEKKLQDYQSGPFKSINYLRNLYEKKEHILCNEIKVLKQLLTEHQKKMHEQKCYLETECRIREERIKQIKDSIASQSSEEQHKMNEQVRELENEKNYYKEQMVLIAVDFIDETIKSKSWERRLAEVNKEKDKLYTQLCQEQNLSQQERQKLQRQIDLQQIKDQIYEEELEETRGEKRRLHLLIEMLREKLKNIRKEKEELEAKLESANDITEQITIQRRVNSLESSLEFYHVQEEVYSGVFLTNETNEQELEEKNRKLRKTMQKLSEDQEMGNSLMSRLSSSDESVQVSPRSEQRVPTHHLVPVVQHLEQTLDFFKERMAASLTLLHHLQEVLPNCEELMRKKEEFVCKQREEMNEIEEEKNVLEERLNVEAGIEEQNTIKSDIQQKSFQIETLRMEILINNGLMDEELVRKIEEILSQTGQDYISRQKEAILFLKEDVKKKGSDLKHVQDNHATYKMMKEEEIQDLNNELQATRIAMEDYKKAWQVYQPSDNAELTAEDITIANAI